MGKYPQDFIDEVLDVFGSDSCIRQSLERGDAIVGRFLGEHSEASFDPRTVVELLSSGQQDVLLRQAERIIRISKLSKRWEELAKAARAAKAA